MIEAIMTIFVWMGLLADWSSDHHRICRRRISGGAAG